MTLVPPDYLFSMLSHCNSAHKPGKKCITFCEKKNTNSHNKYQEKIVFLSNKMHFLAYVKLH